MIKAIDRIPLSRLQLLQSHSTAPSPAKRIKISNKKHPSNFFFGSQSERKMISSTTDVRKQSQTHQEHRRNNPRLMALSIPRREMSTALERKGNQQDLIMGIISTAREMRKMIRKHSIQLKKDRPKRQEDMGIELPKIALKRGATTAF